MRISTAAALATFSCIIEPTLAFTTQSSRSFSTKLHALTHKDILARARKAAGQPEEEDDDTPQIFDDNLLSDMQASLLILEKRVKDGPGALSSGEIKELETMLGRITAEADEVRSKEGSSAATPVSVSTPAAGAEVSPLLTPRNAAPGGEAKTLTDLPPAIGPGSVEHNDEEGAEYDGEGGFGLAKGTTNTWVLPGMDEMTGEEYRAALQESVSARQSTRKSGEVTGNLTSNNYLNSI